MSDGGTVPGLFEAGTDGRTRIPRGRLKYIATRHGLTLTALARASGLAFNTVCQINRGRAPRVDTLERLVAALERRPVSATMAELLEDPFATEAR